MGDMDPPIWLQLRYFKRIPFHFYRLPVVQNFMQSDLT
jgi:hypothetical protein